MLLVKKVMFSYGGRSSVGRAPDCDSGGRGFKPHRPPHAKLSNADVVKLVYTLVLGTSAERRESSSLSIRTSYYHDKWCFIKMNVVGLFNYD